MNYGEKRALEGVSDGDRRASGHSIHRAVPGWVKSTFLRCLNRMNDSINGSSLDGELRYHGHDLYGPGANRVEVRRRIGMVFQKPNPFPKSIYDNIAWAAKEPRAKGRPRWGRVERTLARRRALG